MIKILAAPSTSGLGFSNPGSQKTGLPGGSVAIQFLGGIIFYSLILTMVGVVLSAGLWAVGSFSNNYTQSVNGKRGFLICAAAALVIGGAFVLMQWFFTAGGKLGSS
jgi:hypothetical protein